MDGSHLATAFLMAKTMALGGCPTRTNPSHHTCQARDFEAAG